jgi:hypothetical protein
MLRTPRPDGVWLVTQPDHGELAGTLAAHWGNAAFTRPGHHAPAPDPERLRAEWIFAVAQHDNGWWEWEAQPDLSPDGLPLGLADVLKHQQAGMDRWRLGLRRFPDTPFANLLISRHAHWLYAARVLDAPDPAFNHPFFWLGAPEKLYPGNRTEPLAFLGELEALQAPWREALRGDPATAGWLDAAHLDPATRLLQICDGLSLALCSAVVPPRTGPARGWGEDAFELRDVPRRGWHDRVTIHVEPRGPGRLALDPYPFDLDPLPVTFPARIVPPDAAAGRPFGTWWPTVPRQLVPFTLTAGH